MQSNEMASLIPEAVVDGGVGWILQNSANLTMPTARVTHLSMSYVRLLYFFIFEPEK